MAEYSRTQYDFNSRITLNDDTTDTDKYILVDPDTSLLDTIVENVEEGLPTDEGIVDYGSKKNKGVAEIPVILYASSEAQMEQLIQNFKEAFDPDLLEADATYGEDAGGGGYHPLKWTATVGATSRNFQVYVKSTEIPVVPFDSLYGLIRPAKIKLKARDPRKYLQSQDTLSGAGTATNAGTVPTPVTITITATGASSTSLEIQNSTVSKSIYITKALADGDSLVIDTRKKSVKLNGTEDRSYVGSSSKWWNLDPGDNTIVVNNGTNVTVQTAWYSAWPL